MPVPVALQLLTHPVVQQRKTSAGRIKAARVTFLPKSNVSLVFFSMTKTLFPMRGFYLLFCGERVFRRSAACPLLGLSANDLP